MSTIKVDTIATRTGSGNITLSNNVASLTSAGAISGTNLSASGTLAVTGNTTVGGTLVNTGLVTASAGVAIGGTGSANTLSDYEEGQWTISFPMSGSGSYTVRPGYAGAHYTKVGNLVTVFARFETQGESSPVGNCFIGGFPFNFSNTNPTGGIHSENHPILLRGYSADDSNVGGFFLPTPNTNYGNLFMQKSADGGSDTEYATVTPSDVANFEGALNFTYLTDS